ncbi:MAG: nuclear transport factor 2 family protein [Bauldia sp.]|nr:nuclear transport factor 2 family protein [Bauldia sp.]MCW5719225.1 nuclear transport factor 2 family protein [Bauldia sp.]
MLKLLSRFAPACALLIATATPMTVSAQETRTEERIEAVQSRYEAASVAGDVDAFVGLFTADALYMPVFGGAYAGADAIRSFAATAGRPASLDIRSVAWRWAGELILDVGTFTLVLPPQAGGGTIEGEYTAIVQEVDGDLRLLQLVTFPPRGI